MVKHAGGSTKHSICWSFGHDVRPHKCEANNEVIRFAEQKKLNKGKSTLKEQHGKIILGKKLRYRLGGHALIMIGWWYQKSNSNEFKSACPFH